MDATNSDFDNEWLCPYCAGLTQPDDRRCPVCHKPLLIHRLRDRPRSVWLWRGILLQFIVALYTFAGGASLLIVLAKFNSITDPLPFLPLYLGWPVEQPAALQQTLLAVFPRWMFWGVIILSLYMLGLLVILYSRMVGGNLLYLISGGVTFLAGGLITFIFRSDWPVAAAGITGMVTGVAQLFIALKIEGDFMHTTDRLRFKIDSGVKDHTSFYLTGREYGQAGLWGLAALHLRRAVVAQPNRPAYQLALAVAYLNINRYALAGQTLTTLERLAPNAPEVARLRQKLAAPHRSST